MSREVDTYDLGACTGIDLSPQTSFEIYRPITRLDVFIINK